MKLGFFVEKMDKIYFIGNIYYNVDYIGMLLYKY